MLEIIEMIEYTSQDQLVPIQIYYLCCDTTVPYLIQNAVGTVSELNNCPTSRVFKLIYFF